MRRSGRAWFYRAGALLIGGALVIALLPGGHTTVAPVSGPAAPAKPAVSANIATAAPAAATTPPSETIASAAVPPPAAAQPVAFTPSSGAATAVPAVADGAAPTDTATIAPEWSAYLPHGDGTPAPKPVPPGLPDGAVGAVAVNMRAGPTVDADKIDVLQAGAALKLGETSGNWVHVYEADGTDGWMSAHYLAGAPDAPSATTAAASSAPSAPPPAQSVVGRYARIGGTVPLRSQPAGYSQPMFMLEPGERVRITDTRGGWMRVTTEDGYAGWIPG